MSLTSVSWPLWLLGLLVIGALLFLLQRLRVRHREQVVITTLFWQEAKEEARARTLVERFRHPLAYLMALLLAGLAWWPLATQSFRINGERFTVLLDGSEGMLGGDRFERAKQETVELAGRLPRARTQVVFVGGETRALLLAGGRRFAFDRAVGGIATRARAECGGPGPGDFCPGGGHGGSGPEHPGGGGWSLGERTSPAGQRDFGACSHSGGVGPCGLRNCGLGTGPSGEAWNLVDVLVDVQHGENQQPRLRLMLGEVAWKGAVKQSVQPGGSQFVLQGVPADGALLQVSLDGEPYAHPQASMRLPSRVPIRVYVDPAGDDLALSQVLEADGAFEISASENTSDVALLWSKSATSALPILRFPGADEQGGGDLVAA